MTFVPIHDNTNKSIKLNLFKDNLKRNLIKINDNCLKYILNVEEANCKMHTFNKQEIVPGLLVLKQFYSNISHNCNKAKLKIKNNKNKLKVNALNKTFINVKMKIQDKFILPNLITKIKGNSNTALADIKI